MDELTAIVALSRVKDLNRFQKRKIADTLDRVSSLFEDRSIAGNSLVERALSAFEGWKEIEREFNALEKMGARITSIKDESYPEPLKKIPDAPLLLYQKGRLEAGDNILAIVGSRKATAEGMHLSETIGETMSSLGITVVSGLARGIDASAHKGALRGEGKTIAVLGCGIDICYPAENRRLFERIAEEGVIFTEYGPGTRPFARNFPERNRIIAGLSKGVLVVEAAEKSGSLITARLGAEYGKSVMAIPGSIFDEEYRGANSLIKQGAKLIADSGDIITECFPDRMAVQEKNIAMSENEDYIYSMIGPRRVHIDDVIAKSGMAAKDVMAVLTMLELKEAIREITGGYYIRK